MITLNLQDNADAVVEGIFEQAVKTKSSDIHIDPQKDSLLIRFRIDGVLYPLEGISHGRADEIVSKIKVMSDMDITEKRLPQDGHLEFLSNGKVYDFRVAVTPTIYGEAVAVRMLNKEDIPGNVSDLNLNEAQKDIVQKIISSPFGIVLVTGPTGSGKSTIMYTFLNQLNKLEKNILTLEDPVEYEMKNVRQMQVNESVGWDFARGMRSVLRQDPDVIMLGEIRDKETAEMAFQAALSGRLVFSTFHTFDIPGIVIRLVEMGLPKSIVAHSIGGVVGIRLVKKICQQCVVEYTPEDSDLKKVGMEMGQTTFRRGKGCEACNNSGYSGRVGIFEVIPFDEDIKENIMMDNPNTSLSKLLKAKNYNNFRQSGIEAVANGITTIDEVIRVLGY